MNDLMRLLLGILSGMGFIGGGAILRRDNFVFGVATSATLWFLTVIGLCFGGGQVRGSGWFSGAIALLVWAGLKMVQDRMKQDHEGKLVIITGTDGPNEGEIRAILLNDGFRISSCGLSVADDVGDRELTTDGVKKVKNLLRVHAG